MNDVIDGTAYWAGHAVARPLFVPNGEALLLALPLICLQIDFYSAHNARIASAVLATAIPSVHPPSVRLSVCLSVTRRYCVKTTARSTVQFAPLDSKLKLAARAVLSADAGLLVLPFYIELICIIVHATIER